MPQTLTLRVLGSAAGGGFPQWNCNCAMCAGVRAGTLHAHARTQSSIAITADRRRWLLVNASPDLRQQVLACPDLAPRDGVRDSGVKAVLLIDAQIDHATGLLLLRESSAPLAVYCTRRVCEDLYGGFPLLRMLDSFCGVEHHELAVDGQAFTVDAVPGLRLRSFALDSKPPPYSPHRNAPAPGDNLGLIIENPASGRCALYAPGLGALSPAVSAAMRDCDVLLVDGTCWTDDEMSRRGIGSKTSRAMGHLPQSGAGGMIELLSAWPQKRRVLIHINNTNPILDEDSPERTQLRALGIEVAEDGMEIEL